MNGKRSIKKAEANHPVKKSARVIKARRAEVARKEAVADDDR